ncbi:MAG: hypothetical protein AAB909_01585, partial [Patescibacteria group bacterium]
MARHHIKHALIFTALSLFAAGALFKVHAATLFSISSPVESASTTGSSVQVDFTFPQNLTLTDYVTHPKSSYGQAHVHLWVDQGSPTRTNAIEVTTGSHTLENLKYGPNTLRAELVTNAHTSLLPQSVST